MISQIPKDTSFGYFFSVIFALFSVFFLFRDNLSIFFLFASVSVIFFLFSLFKPNALSPLNRLWMYFGLVLSKIISPIILGFIYYLIFLPVGLIMKSFRRDELRIKIKQKGSHWININQSKKENINFKNQF